jgi:hypothetical protein
VDWALVDWALVFGGDLNCAEDSGACDLLVNGTIGVEHEDWR